MKVEPNTYKIELSHKEIFQIALEFREAIIVHVDKYWINSKDGFDEWQTRDEFRLGIYRELCNGIKRPDFYAELIEIVKERFENGNKTTNK